METRDLILIEHFCANHEIEFSFIDSLHQFGLIEVIIHDDQKYLHQEQLKEVEKMMRMHYELDINMEGIDVISHLLKRMNSLQKELIETQNKLRLFKD
ncbi:MAG: chaperone modulator CbpM [Bacteroidetes bacterium]|jgi:signal transduction histidine kinase|nr:chaperone modulator CbpM [Bacteroidota bacterium]